MRTSQLTDNILKVNGLYPHKGTYKFEKQEDQ